MSLNATELATLAATNQTEYLIQIEAARRWKEYGFYSTYEPSFIAAVVGAVLFSITGLVTIFQYFNLRSWFFWPMLLAGAMNMVGYIARAPSTKDVQNKEVFAVQFCLIILAPAIMAASLYMVFGRIVFWVTPKQYRGFRHLWVPARFVTPIFVTFDVIAFAVQLIGAAIIADSDPSDFDRINRGSDIVKIGLAVQLVCFGFFTFVGLRFSFAARKFVDDTHPRNHGWKRLSWAVNIGCGMILIRSVFRMIEFAEDSENGYLRSHEVWYWILDALLMFVVHVIFNVFHPGYYLPFLGLRGRKKATPENMEMNSNGFAKHNRQNPSLSASERNGQRPLYSGNAV